MPHPQAVLVWHRHALAREQDLVRARLQVSLPPRPPTCQAPVSGRPVCSGAFRSCPPAPPPAWQSVCSLPAHLPSDALLWFGCLPPPPRDVVSGPVMVFSVAAVSEAQRS